MSVDYYDTRQAIKENTCTRENLLDAYAHGQDDAAEGRPKANPYTHDWTHNAYECGYNEYE